MSNSQAMEKVGVAYRMLVRAEVALPHGDVTGGARDELSRRCLSDALAAKRQCNDILFGDGPPAVRVTVEQRDRAKASLSP